MIWSSLANLLWFVLFVLVPTAILVFVFAKSMINGIWFFTLVFIPAFVCFVFYFQSGRWLAGLYAYIAGICGYALIAVLSLGATALNRWCKGHRSSNKDVS